MTTTFTANISVTGGSRSSVTDGAINFPFVGASNYNTGVTLDGLPYVIAPAAIKLTEPTPASTTVSSRYMNGQMINPQRISGGVSQAVDSGVSGGLSAYTYSASFAASFANAIAANSSIIKADAKTGTIVNDRRGLLDQWSGLYVVASAKAANVMAPFVWPSADLANRPWRPVDVDGLLAGITSCATLGTEVPWATLAPYYARLDLGPAITADIIGGPQYISPYLMGDAQGGNANYDQSKISLQDHVLIGIMSNSWSTADKRAALISVLQRGCQQGETLVAFNTPLGEDGAQYASQYACCMAWLRATGQESQYNTWISIVGGSFYGQYYTVGNGTGGTISYASHTDPAKPYIARERAVKAGGIDSSGTGTIGVTTYPHVVTVDDYRPGSGLGGDTDSNGVFHGLNLVRKSNGATAYITASAQLAPGSGVKLGMASLPAGLTAGDTVYCAEVTPMSAGTVDWTVRNITTYPNLPNPSASAEYRNQQITGISHLFVHNIGMHKASNTQMALSKAYCQRAMTGGSGLPSMVQALDASVTGGANSTSAAFYAAYQAALFAKTQAI
jgi:hypothetical protein